LVRLFALAALLCGFIAGPALAATGDDRPDPDACTLLNDLDLSPILFGDTRGVLDSRSEHPAPGYSKCIWWAHLQDRPANARPRMLVLHVFHMANPQRAQKELDSEPRGDTRPSMALSGTGDDAVARPSPTLVLARHGAEVAAVNAAGAELADPGQPEARYLLDTLALKAAGARVKGPPWAAPGRQAEATPLDEGGPGTEQELDAWAPPPRPPGPAGARLEPAIHLLYMLARNGFLLMQPLGIGAALLMIFGGDRVSARRAYAPAAGWPPSGPRDLARFWPVATGAVLLGLGLLNALAGPALAYRLVDRFGVSGAAVATGGFATNTLYNHQPVVGYRVLIRTAPHRFAQAQFRTDSFNVVPSGAAVIYPQPGEVFTARYLPHHPKDFIILSDDASPWARDHACTRQAGAPCP
jgi:hypothetical protein